ncbi:MAG: TIGR00297 family protein, partial [Methanosarcina mazei]
MNRAIPLLENGCSYHGIPVMHVLYLLLILIAPFAGVDLLLVLSLGVFLLLRFSGKFLSCSRDAVCLSFSFSLMLLVSAVSKDLPYTFPFYIVLAAFAVAAVGNHSSFFSERGFTADFESEKSRRRQRRFSIIWSSIFLALRIIAAFVAASWIVYWQNLPVSYNFIFFIAVIGAVTGSLFESIPSKIDRNIPVPLGAGMMMWIFEEFRYWVPPEKMLVALVFSL